MNTRSIAYIIFSLTLSVMVAACASPRDDVVAGDGDTVMLSFRILPVGSRAEDGVTLKSDYMHDLRFVIVKGDKVVVNEAYSLGGDVYDAQTPFHEVKIGDRLDIYLLANCEDMDFGNGVDLSDNSLYTSGRVENLTFVQKIEDADHYVPMTNKVSLQIPSRDKIPEDGKYVYPETLYVVRAANKLTVSFNNETEKNIDLRSYSLSNVNTAGTTFLIPKVEDIDWLEILKAAAYNESDTSDDWILSYSIPENSLHDVADFTIKDGKVLAPGESFTDTSWLFAESRDLKNVVEGRHTYQFSVKTADDVYSTAYLTPAYLENLSSLFRNTDVRINVTFSEFGVEIDVQPYQKYELTVDFGLLRNNLGDLMILLDNDGNYSKQFEVYLKAYKKKNEIDLLDLKSSEPPYDKLKLADGDYYAIHVGSDGDIYSKSTELWVMDSDGCRVMSNFAEIDGHSSICSSRHVVYFSNTSPDSGFDYRKDSEHDIRLQHHSDHSCVVLKMDGKMYLKQYKSTDGEMENPSYLHVESWEGSWDGKTSTPGEFYVEVIKDGKLCYQKYTNDGVATDEYIEPEEVLNF